MPSTTPHPLGALRCSRSGELHCFGFPSHQWKLAFDQLEVVMSTLNKRSLNHFIRTTLNLTMFLKQHKQGKGAAVTQLGDPDQWGGGVFSGLA